MRGLRLAFHFLLFLLTFVVEVRVHASTAKVVLIQQEPLHCLKSKSPCAIKTRAGQVFELVLNDDTSIYLDHQSSIIRVSDSEIRLISGSVWVKAHAGFKVKSEFGDVVSQSGGDFWVFRTASRVTARASGARLGLMPRGPEKTGSEELTIDPGLENYIGSVRLDGKAETGIPLAIDFKSHLLQWARVYRGPKQEFESQVDAFHKTWTEAAQESAAINKAVYDRVISSVETEKAEEAARQAKVQAEREANRKFFRSRVFDGL